MCDINEDCILYESVHKKNLKQRKKLYKRIFKKKIRAKRPNQEVTQ